MDFEYDQIIDRFSVRRYQQTGFDVSRLMEIENFACHPESLREKYSFSCGIYEFDASSKTSGALGIFGRIFAAPYFIAPFIIEETDALLDLGFRTQQVVLDLWQEGIGSCYIGCVHKQKRVIDLLDLPKSARVISMVAFGIPAKDQSKYLYQKVSQAFARSKKRLDYKDLLLEGSLQYYAELSEIIKKIVEAGRQSPSATNAQPWRFRISQEYFEIFIKRKSFGSLFDLDQEYTLHDVGICMANISRAAKALGKMINWELFPIADQNPKDGMIRIARFRIDL